MSTSGLYSKSRISEATSARIHLIQSDGHLAFEVADDGVGFDLAHAHGSGLTNMRDRVEAVGGALEVTSRPGSGTTIAGRIFVEVGP